MEFGGEFDKNALHGIFSGRAWRTEVAELVEFRNPCEYYHYWSIESGTLSLNGEFLGADDFFFKNVK